MDVDLFLAILHHALVIGIVVMLAIQLALVRPGMTGEAAGRVARMDLGYGLSALLILLVGVLRVNYGAKGGEWYEANLWFWLKMGAFALIGLLSLPPSLRFAKWNKALKGDAQFAPQAGEVARIRPFILAETGLLLLVAAFAAAMARYDGTGA